jgi:hypothetical protein
LPTRLTRCGGTSASRWTKPLRGGSTDIDIVSYLAVALPLS